MDKKVFIRKEERSKVFSIFGITLLVSILLISLVLQFLGVFFLLFDLCLSLVAIIVAVRIAFLIYYDLKFTDSTYEYVIFDSVKLILIIPLLIYSVSTFIEFKEAEIKESKFIVSDVNVYSYYLNNYNEIVCKDPSDGEKEITFRFVFPGKNLDFFVSEDLEGCEFNFKYLEFNDKYFILEVDGGL